ncbi:MAG: SPOR domain-containing protein [Thiomicrospira sp.]|uniref:SPOR domain-containing protein n=1 Tax=Thiomicrospira sp. TaxID=935 RepID=UPI0019DFB01F|nr:SPOR domain-containing protein [Thiomicrospira sp.]MBE0493079.1 SPOR domain-containing protein [Thiomicrospira sp.]
MAQDFRHAPMRRKTYQRKSQLNPDSSSTSTRPGGSFSSAQTLWLVGFVLSLVLVTVFFVVKHFASQGVKASESRSSQVYQAQTPVSVEADKQMIELDAPVEISVSTETEDLNDPVVKTQYTFYKDLPNTEVVVDVEPLPITLPEPMWIQAGSFAKLEQAEREQKRLSNEQRQVNIAPIDTQRGRYYRIMLGPFTDRLVMNQQRNELRRLGADTRVVRIQTD